MPDKDRTPSQQDSDPLNSMVSEEPTLDELLENATDDELDRIAAGEDPRAVLGLMDSEVKVRA